jgi:hypothetical protein
MFEIVIVHRVVSSSFKSTMLPGISEWGWKVEAVDKCGKNVPTARNWELQNLYTNGMRLI